MDPAFMFNIYSVEHEKAIHENLIIPVSGLSLTTYHFPKRIQMIDYFCLHSQKERDKIKSIFPMSIKKQTQFSN